MMPTPLFRSAFALLLAPALLRAQAPDTLAARPIPLKEAVALAQQNGLTAVQARGQVRNAESSSRAARAALFPSLNFTMGQVNQSGDRFDSLELNIAITAMPIDESGMPDLSIPRRFLPHLTDEELLRHPGVLSGSTQDMADRIRGLRDTYGISYIIVQAPHIEVFAKVIAELR